MLELLFLLLPVAVLYGWFIGRRESGRRSGFFHLRHRREYVAGVNYLLNDEADKAVDILTRVLPLERDTFDLQISLGVLFRRKGEIDKAVRIHQNLLSLENLSQQQRDEADFALAMDYLSLRVYDRSIPVLQRLLKSPERKKEAAETLIRISEQLREWDRAIMYSEKFRDLLSSPERVKALANYHCELADASAEAGSYETAVEHYRRALEIDPKCFRAIFSEAKLYLAEQDYTAARQTIDLAPEAQPDCVMFCVPVLAACFHKPESSPEYVRILMRWFAVSFSAAVASELVRCLMSRGNEGGARKLAIGYLRENPNVLMLSRFLELVGKSEADPEVMDTMNYLVSIIEARFDVKDKYCCRSCGYVSKYLFWRCPKCGRWSTVRPDDRFVSG